MVTRIILATLIACFRILAFAADLPCATAQREVRAEAPELPSSFWECLHASRVCVVLDYPEVKVLQAASVRELSTDGSVNFGIVQSAAGDKPAVCLVGAYSGGSAAAWIFYGWKIEQGKPVQLNGMEKSHMNSDAVPPRTLGNAIYGAYVRSQK